MRQKSDLNVECFILDIDYVPCHNDIARILRSLSVPNLAIFQYLQEIISTVYYELFYIKKCSNENSYRSHFIPDSAFLFLTIYKIKFLLNNVLKSSFYLTGNTLHLRYKDQPVNNV
jgi:hypothetical protein